jgi:hypothetical protein
MYEAHLCDTAHGEATHRAETPKAAVDAAFRELARRWINREDLAKLKDNEPAFDGDILANGEVWWSYGSHNGLLGVVRRVPGAGPRAYAFTDYSTYEPGQGGYTPRYVFHAHGQQLIVDFMGDESDRLPPQTREEAIMLLSQRRDRLREDANQLDDFLVLAEQTTAYDCDQDA